MKKKHFPTNATPSAPKPKRNWSRFVPKIVHDENALPCRSLREEFDSELKKSYTNISDDVIRQAWLKAGALLMKNPQARMADVVIKAMEDHLGPYTLGTA